MSALGRKRSAAIGARVSFGRDVRRSKADLKAYRLPGKTAAEVRPVAADWNSGEAAPNRRPGSFAMTNSWDRVPIEPQSVIAPLSRAAVFLVLTIGVEAEAMAKVRRVISDIGGLVRASTGSCSHVRRLAYSHRANGEDDESGCTCDS